MSRIIEIVLFLTPFVGFFTWRVLFPSPMPPTWLIYGLAAFVGVLLLGLLWVWHIDASDANQPYVPAEMRDGRIIQPRLATPK